MPLRCFVYPKFFLMKSTRPRVTSRGFSLIELLVVCSIIALVVGFTVPAATTLIRGSQLTQAAQAVSDQISLARQQALSKNRPVEVRFYRFGDRESPGENSEDPESGKYRAMQCFEIIESGAAIPLNKIQRLPATVVFNRAGMSTLLDESLRGVAKNAEDDSSAPELAREVEKEISVSSIPIPAGWFNRLARRSNIGHLW